MTKGDHIQASAMTIAAIAPAGVASMTNGSEVKWFITQLTRPKVGS